MTTIEQIVEALFTIKQTPPPSKGDTLRLYKDDEHLGGRSKEDVRKILESHLQLAIFRTEVPPPAQWIRQFEVRLNTSDEPGNVLVSEGVEYFYVDGVDVNCLRLPKDTQSLNAIAELVAKLNDLPI